MVDELTSRKQNLKQEEDLQCQVRRAEDLKISGSKAATRCK